MEQGAASFHRQLVKADLASEYGNENPRLAGRAGVGQGGPARGRHAGRSPPRRVIGTSSPARARAPVVAPVDGRLPAVNWEGTSPTRSASPRSLPSRGKRPAGVFLPDRPPRAADADLGGRNVSCSPRPRRRRSCERPAATLRSRSAYHRLDRKPAGEGIEAIRVAAARGAGGPPSWHFRIPWRGRPRAVVSSRPCRAYREGSHERV